MSAPVRAVQLDFVPASYTANETKTLYTLEDGEVVIAKGARVTEAFNGTGASVELGNPDNTAGYATAASVGAGSAGIKRITGAFVNGETMAIAANSRKIDATFVAGTGTRTTGRVRFTLVIAKLEV